MNEINYIPFNQISRAVQQNFETTCAAALEIKRNKLSAPNVRTLSMLFEDNIDSEAGSDGIEESLAEQINVVDPSSVFLSVEEKVEIHTRLRKDIVKAFVEKHNISSMQSWLPSQLLAYFGNWKAVKNSSGKYDAMLTYAENCKDDFSKGILMFAVSTSRGEIIRGTLKTQVQYKSPINPLVPIILAGFKRNQNIPYMAWDRVGINRFVDNDLYQAMICQVPEISAKDLLLIRTAATSVATGPRAGRSENPISSVKLTGTQLTPLAHVPKLAKYMLMQTWCAHPTNRTPLGIYDPTDWDNVPPALVPSEVFEQVEESKPIQNFTVDYPW
jgi:hypothetical protein